MTEAEWLASTDTFAMREFLETHTTGFRSRWLGWLAHHPFRPSDRKLRLFAVACCRRVWDLIPTEEGRRCVEVVEAAADGLATEADVRAAERASIDAYGLAGMPRPLPDGGPWPWEVQAMNAVSRVVRQETEGRSGVVYGAAAAAAIAARNDQILTTAEHLQGADPPVARNWWEIEAHPEWGVKPFLDVEMALLADLFRDLMGNPFRPAELDPAWLRHAGGTALAIARRVYDERRFDDLPVLADALMDAGCADDAILGHCRSPGPHARGCWVVDLILGKT